MVKRGVTKVLDGARGGVGYHALGLVDYGY